MASDRLKLVTARIVGTTYHGKLHTIRNFFTQFRAASRARASDAPAVNRNSENGFLSESRLALKCSHLPHDTEYGSPMPYGRLKDPEKNDDIYSISDT
jgi:hypothetical protein